MAEQIETLIVGGGQAGLAMSSHLRDLGFAHLILERGRIAERWRSWRWDSLVANGPAWHDRFPTRSHTAAPEIFPPKEQMADYFVDFAQQIDAPIRCGVEVNAVTKLPGRKGFRVETSTGVIEAQHVIAATGPFQRPLIPDVVPQSLGLMQMHSVDYRNPDQLPEGAVLVVGAGSSGAQIADELLRAGRKVYLSVGPHDRPPRAYRGIDYCWWLGVLGKWDASRVTPGREHVTIAVSGAYGGQTVDFRAFAARGMILLGRAGDCVDGKLQVADDLAVNLANGDANYLSVLREADAYAAAMGLDLPEEPQAHVIPPDPDCVTNPIHALDLSQVGSIIWATGFAPDYSWIKSDIFEPSGRPIHERGVSPEPGLYFLGLPWQSRRGSAFIWGVWHDAKYLADHLAIQRSYADHHATTATAKG